MTFLYPTFLLAAAAIAIPIIIHLFRFRKFKKVYFPDIRFLKQLQESTRNRSRLQHLLILACRILTILALVAAFAQPVLNRSQQQAASNATALLVDNSFSMGIKTDGTSLLEKARAEAIDLIQQTPEGRQFYVLTPELQAAQFTPLSKTEALQAVQSIRPSAASRPASEVLSRIGSTINDAPLLFFSDLQQNQWTPADFKTVKNLTYLVPLQAQTVQNMVLDTARLLSPVIQPNQPQKLWVSIRNQQNQPVENGTITLAVNNQVKTVRQFKAAANSTVNDTLNFTTGQDTWQNISVYINDNPVTFDDSLFIAARVSNNLKIALVGNGNTPFLQTIFKADPVFTVQGYTYNNLKQVPESGLIILDQLTALDATQEKQLSDWLNAGRNVLIFPAPNLNPQSVNTALKNIAGLEFGAIDTQRQSITALNRNTQLIQGIFDKIPDNIELPQVFRHFPIVSGTNSMEQPVMSFSDGSGFLNEYRVGNGKLYLCAAPADIQFSNWPSSYLFLPLVYQMAFTGSNDAIYSVQLGSRQAISIPNSNISNDKNMFRLSGQGTSLIPRQVSRGNQTMLYFDNMNQAGIFTLQQDQADPLYTGLNYNRNESRLQYFNPQDIAAANPDHIKLLEGKRNVAVQFNKAQYGTALWKVCIILALLFLTLEILLIRFYPKS